MTFYDQAVITIPVTLSSRRKLTNVQAMLLIEMLSQPGTRNHEPNLAPPHILNHKIN